MPPAYDEEEGMGPLEKGRHRYQKKNYQGALLAFTEAIKLSTDNLLLTALDHRAATFEKLDLLQSALRDAKEMLELKPELSKGYLRCGKVLQLKGEHKLALKIYERGLGKVKVGTDKDRVGLFECQKKLSQKALRAYLKRSNYTVGEARIRNGSIDSAKFQYLIRTCTKLQRLEVFGGDPVGESLTSALPLAKSLQYLKISWECVISFPSALESLRHVQATIVEATFGDIHYYVPSNSWTWPKLENLQTLRIDSRHRDGILLKNLIDSIPKIKTLSLKRFDLEGVVPLDLRELQGLEDLELIDCGLRRLPLLPSTLKRLVLRDNLRLFDQQEDTVSLSLLETFNCDSTGLSDETVVSVIKNAPNLKHLHMGSRLVGDYIATHQSFPLCENIEELCVSYLPYEEKDFINLTSKCPNLKRLDISGTKITGVAVKHFVGQGITWIDLQVCDKVSPDAVEYARGKGAEVIFSFGRRSRPSWREQVGGLV
ncbi:hypothetical protein EYC80_011130 [Monilinia laxa]|uniref:Uncharacterized protein n=1 Tax=Monilinia laxa TaxID=61186 RepID=A0A5N6JRY1_MONLA|nr:hypothetical protein EYC80_011130 [Monilinia laxa]